jgi:hypothetical protein
MRRLIKRWLANWILTDRDRLQVERQGHGQPWIRSWLRREFWEPARRELLGLYPPGHPYYQENPIVRFYPMVMTVLVVGAIVVSVIAGVLRWLVR